MQQRNEQSRVSWDKYAYSTYYDAVVRVANLGGGYVLTDALVYKAQLEHHVWERLYSLVEELIDRPLTDEELLHVIEANLHE